MLVVKEEAGLSLITQTDHARLAAEVLALWRADGLPEHPRRRRLLEAVREHDNGWREADAAPRVNPADGRPFDFRHQPAADRREIWRRGIARLEPERPYAAALVARHARALAATDPGTAALRAAAAERLQELDPATGLDSETLDADYEWLGMADLFSLAACHRWNEPVRARDTTAVWRDGALRLDPFPLAGATTFALPARSIPDRRYAGDADLGGELAAARWRQMSLRVAPEA